MPVVHEHIDFDGWACGRCISRPAMMNSIDTRTCVSTIF